jgi:hypothetical protein
LDRSVECGGEGVFVAHQRRNSKLGTFARKG